MRSRWWISAPSATAISPSAASCPSSPASASSPRYLTPLFLGYVRGYDAFQTGVAVFSTGVASMVGVPVYIFLAKRFDTRWLMMFGLASFGASMWSFSAITSQWGAAELLLPQIFR